MHGIPKKKKLMWGEKKQKKTEGAKERRMDYVKGGPGFRLNRI